MLLRGWVRGNSAVVSWRVGRRDRRTGVHTGRTFLPGTGSAGSRPQRVQMSSSGRLSSESSQTGGGSAAVAAAVRVAAELGLTAIRHFVIMRKRSFAKLAFGRNCNSGSLLISECPRLPDYTHRAGEMRRESPLSPETEQVNQPRLH